MKRLRLRAEETDEARIELAPLLDVVFLLLIFYVLAATLVTPTALPIQRPHAQQAAALPERPLLVAITAHGQVLIDDQPWATGDQATLARALAASPGQRVLIHADGQTATQHLVEVMDACLLAGAQRIDLAAALEAGR